MKIFELRDVILKKNSFYIFTTEVNCEINQVFRYEWLRSMEFQKDQGKYNN